MNQGTTLSASKTTGGDFPRQKNELQLKEVHVVPLDVGHSRCFPKPLVCTWRSHRILNRTWVLINLSRGAIKYMEIWDYTLVLVFLVYICWGLAWSRGSKDCRDDNRLLIPEVRAGLFPTWDRGLVSWGKVFKLYTSSDKAVLSVLVYGNDPTIYLRREGRTDNKSVLQGTPRISRPGLSAQFNVLRARLTRGIVTGSARHVLHTLSKSTFTPVGQWWLGKSNGIKLEFIHTPVRCLLSGVTPLPWDSIRGFSQEWAR